MLNVYKNIISIDINHVYYNQYSVLLNNIYRISIHTYDVSKFIKIFLIIKLESKKGN